MKPTGMQATKAALTALILSTGTAVTGEEAEAQAETEAGHLRVELNAMDPMQNACRLSFLVESSHEADITKAVFEAVLFDSEGRVNRLSLFDFGLLPAGRPRVRQFVVPDLACADLGRVLINGVTSCEGEGLDESACLNGLELVSRTEVEVIG